MRAATVTTIVGASFYVLAPSVDRSHELGPMEAAPTPAPVVGDRVLIAPRADTGGWVIVATMPPA